ncbi:MAG: DUF429 domain-containing protein [Dehalococcoidia bacterium]
MFYVGVDACKGGWFTVRLKDANEWAVSIFETIEELWQGCKNAKLILIDIPIGLRDSGNGERVCDKEARKRLGSKRSSSVFPVPCRPAVYSESLEKASEINRQKTGRRLSRQSLAIIPRIRQLDEFLPNNKVAVSKIREIHPEMCFYGFNSGQPMEYSKKMNDGFNERLNVLRHVFPATDAVVEYARHNFRRTRLAKDDILDALVAAVTASREKQGLLTIPEIPEIDSKGLPMEMLYCRSWCSIH